MSEAVARFLEASVTDDVDAMLATLAPDAELVSPVSGRMVFRGPDDMRVLLRAVYGSVRELRWEPPVGSGRVVAVAGEAKIGPLTLGDVMLLELDENGEILRIRPHLRPWLGLTLFALRLGATLVRHPDVIRRALTRAASSESG